MFTISASQDRFRLKAGRWQREFHCSPFGAVSTSIDFAQQTLLLSTPTEPEPECIYDGLARLAYRRRLDPWVPLALQNVEQNDELSLRLTWAHEGQGFELSRYWQILPDVEAWITHAEIRSEAAPQVEFGRHDYFNVIETLPLDLTNWRARAIRFFGRTDRHNEMLLEDEFTIEPGSAPRSMNGNLLFLAAPDGDWGLFVLHEAPPEDEKRRECEASFLVGSQGARVLGWGIAPHEVSPDRAQASYRVAVGVYEGGTSGQLEALRRYLKARFPLLPAERAIVANPWGDRHCYENLAEAFVLQELEACAELGITHYQIDDGWQAGGVLPDLNIHNWARDKDFWEIHPEKFPHGFTVLAQRAKELGVQLALWFAPDGNRHYRNWREERDILLEFHRRYEIDLIKIDAVWLRTKEAEENLCSLLREVHRASQGKVRFNLDVTEGRRLGYFANLEFGSLFVENRYVTSGGEPAKIYAPHQTLCNFWKLAHYVPPEKMQFEAPNIANILPQLRNQSDPLNVVHYDWDYNAAIPLFCSPLIWCEPSQLPAEARASWKHILGLHHSLRDELFAGYTLPVGDEPDGHAWTGFQSYRPDSPQRGLLQVFREWNEEETHGFHLHRVAPNARLHLACLSHPEPEKTLTVDDTGCLKLHIERARDFRVYRYEVER